MPIVVLLPLGKQAIFLMRYFCWLTRILHELMHAVGFWHEQSRPDRDEHVTIKWENINRKDLRHNFQKKPLSLVNMVGQYDFCSLMHYSLSAFGKIINGLELQTILPKHKRYRKYCLDHEIGKRQDFSPGDLEKLNILYNCNSKKGKYILLFVHKIMRPVC